MKSNGKYVFSLFTTPVCDYFDVIYSTSHLVYNMDECSICGKAEFNAIFLRLRWKLEDFDQIAGWGHV